MNSRDKGKEWSKINMFLKTCKKKPVRKSKFKKSLIPVIKTVLYKVRCLCPVVVNERI